MTSALTQNSDAAPDPSYAVDAAHCVCCGTCVAVCPVKAIGMTEISAVIRGQCIACGACEAACPADAIRQIH